METPVVLDERERERERERVDSSTSFLRRHKLLLGVIVIIGILLYAAFNAWFFRYTKNRSAGFGGFQSESRGRIPTPTPRLSPTAPPAKQDLAPPDTPTPRPTGPGEYACDPYGVCNKYGEAARKEFCTQTYADGLCLDQCGDKEKQCKK